MMLVGPGDRRKGDDSSQSESACAQLQRKLIMGSILSVRPWTEGRETPAVALRQRCGGAVPQASSFLPVVHSGRWRGVGRPSASRRRLPRRPGCLPPLPLKPRPGLNGEPFWIPRLLTLSLAEIQERTGSSRLRGPRNTLMEGIPCHPQRKFPRPLHVPWQGFLL